MPSSPEEAARLTAALDDWRRQATEAFVAACARPAATADCGRAIRRSAERLLRFFVAREGRLRDRLRAREPARLGPCSAGGTAASACFRRKATRHDVICRPKRRAIVGGYHADPFRYLGLHDENGTPVVRAFLPGADEVIVVDDARHRNRAGARSTRPACSPGRCTRPTVRYRLQARWNGAGGRDRGRLSLSAGAVRLRSLSARRRHPSARLRQARRASDGAGRRRRRRLRGVRAQCAARQRGRRLQLLGRPPPRHAGARQRLLGDLRARRHRRAEVQVRDRSARNGAPAAQVRSLCVRRPSCGRRPHRSSIDPSALERSAEAPPGANRRDAPISIYEVHLGSWRRKPEEGNRWLTYRELAGRAAGLCRRSRLHPCRADADHGASVRRLVGLSADRAVCADQPVRLAGGFRSPSSMPSIAPASA